MFGVGETVNIGTVAAFLTLDSRGFVRPLATAESMLTSFARKHESTLAGIAARSNALALTTGAMGAGLAAGLAVAAKAGSDFERQMELLHTQAGATQAEVAALTKQVLALAPAVGAMPLDLSKGLYHIVSLGIPAADRMRTLQLAAEGAKVGLSDVDTTVNALTSTLYSGIKGVTSASQAMGVLNAIVGSGNMHMQDLIGAISTGLLGAATTFGVSLQDIGASLATLTDMGMPATEAATRLGMTLSLLGAPSEKADKVLKSIGLSGLQLAEDMRKPGGPINAVVELTQHMQKAGLSASQQAEIITRAFGGGRSNRALMTLINQMERLGNKINIVHLSTDKFGESWKATTQTAAFKADQLRASIAVLETKIGEDLLPVAKDALTVLKGWVEVLDRVSPENRRTAEEIAAVGAAGLLTVSAIAKLIALGPAIRALFSIIDAGAGLATRSLATETAAARTAGIAAVELEVPLRGMANAFESAVVPINAATGALDREAGAARTAAVASESAATRISLAARAGGLALSGLMAAVSRTAPLTFDQIAARFPGLYHLIGKKTPNEKAQSALLGSITHRISHPGTLLGSITHAIATAPIPSSTGPIVPGAGGGGGAGGSGGGGGGGAGDKAAKQAKAHEQALTQEMQDAQDEIYNLTHTQFQQRWRDAVRELRQGKAAGFPPALVYARYYAKIQGIEREAVPAGIGGSADTGWGMLGAQMRQAGVDAKAAAGLGVLSGGSVSGNWMLSQAIRQRENQVNAARAGAAFAGLDQAMGAGWGMYGSGVASNAAARKLGMLTSGIDASMASGNALMSHAFAYAGKYGGKPSEHPGETLNDTLARLNAAIEGTFGRTGRAGLLGTVITGCFGPDGRSGLFGDAVKGSLGRGGMLEQALSGIVGLVQAIGGSRGGGGGGFFGGILKMAGLGGIGQALDLGWGIGSAIGGAFGSRGASGPHVVNTTVHVNGPVTVRSEQDIQRISEQVAWHATQRLKVLGT